MDRIGQNFHVLASVDSTNNYAMAQVQKGVARHGETWFALEQTAGRGQRGKQWMTAKGENILMSTVLHLPWLSTNYLSLLNMTVALSCCQLLRRFAKDEIKIKWPNDLYWNDRKAGGILIENSHAGKSGQVAVVGIGLNINQTVFPPHLPNPVGMKQVLGRELDVVDQARELCVLLESHYQLLLLGEKAAVLEQYNEALYKRHETARLRKGNVVFPAWIEGVDDQGTLLVRSNLSQHFRTGEVEWVLEGS